MEQITNYKWGLVYKDNIIKLFNNSTFEAPVLTTDFLENVEIKYNDDDTITLTGHIIEYDLYTERGRIFENKWKREPDPKLIKEGKRYWWSKKIEKYIEGGRWIRTTVRTHVTYKFKGDYRIEIYD